MPKAKKQDNNESAMKAKIDELQTQLQEEAKARQDAEVRAEQAEDKNDHSVRKTVMAEAQAVAASQKHRKPVISTMAGGITRIDF